MVKSIYQNVTIENYPLGVMAPSDLHEPAGNAGTVVNVLAPPNSGDFITDQINCPIAFFAPEEAVRKGFAQPFFASDLGDTPMVQPQNAPVQVAVRISNDERDRLSSFARAFFAGVMRPTVKHI